MDNTQNYIQIMISSLKKKISILEDISVQNEKQYEVSQSGKIDDEIMEQTYGEKERLINELQELDNGFDTLYTRVKDELADENNKKMYAIQIKEMQTLIETITEKSMNIQRQEKRNQEMVMTLINNERKAISVTKSARKVTSDYYKNMNKVNYIDPQFMDKKN